MPHSDQSVPAQQSPPEHHRAFPPNPLPHSERPSSPARRSSHHSAPSAPAAEAAAAAEVNTLRLRGLPPAGNGGLWWPDVPGYEIHGELGRGGMGVVYKARQRGLNRLVALKMVLAGAHASAEELHRFLDEAEAVAKLRHPHIVQVYDLGIQDNRPFYSMELVEGTNLEQYLADTPQPPDIAARLVALLARAVDYAHQRGIVHRDLKPANILLASGGREPPDGSQLSGGLRPPLAEPVPKITDFGLAKHLDRSVSHTQTGVVMGTPSYMAPEQASGTSAAIGPHTDVYGLGAILYEMLTGRSPFRAETEVETLRLVLETEPVPPRSLQPGVPRDVETICLKCLQKEPAKRYRSAAQLADDLDRFLRGEPIQARPVGTGERLWRWCKRKPVVASLSAALLVVFVSAFAAVTGLWLLAEDRRHLAEQETHKARTSAEEADNQRHNADRNYREVMQQRDREQFQMVRLHLANGARRLEDGDLLAGSVWFTEAFRRDLALDAGTLADKQRSRKHRERLALLAQQCPRLVQFWAHEDGDVCGVSNDARWLLTSTLKGVSRVWDTATGQPVTAAPLNHPNPVLGGYFSPDGKRVLLTSYNGGAIQWEVVTSKQIPLTGLDGRTKVAQFSPDGRYLVTLTGDDVLRWWNLATGQVREAAGRHLGNVRIAISPNSKYVALTANVATWLWDLATGEQPAREPFGQTRGFELVAFSPDGHWIATTAKHWAVEIRSVQGGSPREFSHRGDVRHAEFSPDTGETTPGRGRLLTASNDGTAQVWDLRTGGSAAPAMVHGSAVALARFSPAGRWVATACDDARIRVWDAATGQPVVPPLRHGGRILWIGFRPDGRHLLTLAADRTARVWDLTTGLPGLPLRGHKEKVSFATFSPDQKLVATVSDDRTARLWDARTGQAHTPPLVHAGKVLHASFTPDSKVLVTTSADFTCRLWCTSSGEPLSAPTGRHLGNNLGVSHAAFSRDGRYLLINFVDRANVYDWRLKHDVVQILHPFWIDQADSSPDGNRVVTVSRMSAVAVITDVPSNKQWRTLAHNQQVTSACFSPDGKYILTTSEDRTARLWDAATAELVGEPWQHASAVLRAHFSRDSRQAVTLCNDGSARVWSVPTGKPLTPALRGSGAIVTARISPDGQLLATGLQDGTAWLWDIDSGLPVAPFCRLSGPVTCVEFSGDGQRLLTAGPDAVPRLHTLPAADPRPLDELTSWTPLLSGHRIDGDAGMLAPLPARDLLLAWQNTAGRKQKAEAQGPEGAAQLLAWHQQVCADATARREWRVALFHLDAVIRAEPKKAALHSQRGQINPLRGHSTQAIADFTQALALDPNDGLALDGRAQAYAALGRWDQSLPDWAQAVERLPADPQRLLYLSLACAVTGDRAGADAAYQRAEVLAMATQLSPQATWNQRHLHARPVEPDSWHELIEDCELLAVDLTDQPTGPAIYRACGLAHAVLQDWSEALESYHTVLALDPQDWRARCARACIHAERKDYAAAIADLNQVLKGSPQHGSAWYLRGSLLRALRQQAAVAAHDFTRAIAAGLDSGVVRLQRGLAYAEMEQWPQAAADLEAARRQGLGSDALVPLTLVLLAQGQLPAARDASADLVKTLTSTEDPQLAVKIAWVCSLQAGAEMGPCRALLERLTSSLKDVSWLWTVQAAVLYRSGKYAEAEAALAKSLALHKQGAVCSTGTCWR